MTTIDVEITKGKMDANDFTIRQSKLKLAIYIIFTAFFSFFTFEIALEDGITKLFLLFLLYSSIGSLLLISCLRWKIIIKDKQITYTPSFGETKSFPLSHITKSERGLVFWSRFREEYIKAYHYDKELFSISEHCKNFNAF